MVKMVRRQRPAEPAIPAGSLVGGATPSTRYVRGLVERGIGRPERLAPSVALPGVPRETLTFEDRPAVGATGSGVPPDTRFSLRDPVPMVVVSKAPRSPSEKKTVASGPNVSTTRPQNAPPGSRGGGKKLGKS